VRDNVFQICLTMWDPCIQWPRGLSCGPVAPRLLRLWVRTRRVHARVSNVIVVCCHVEVSEDELITRLEESYRLWCVVVCDLETS